IMIVQLLDSKYWLDYEEKLIDKANEGDIAPLLNAVVEKFNSHNCKVKEANGILHDKDTRKIWDNQINDYKEEPKGKHVHFLIKFERGDTINSLANYCGIEPQYLEIAKSGRYGYDNLLAYLIHSKDTDKYQYKPTEVVTIAGTQYMDIYSDRHEAWIRGKATKQANLAKKDIDYVISEIINGNISKQQLLLTDNLYLVYSQNKRKINEAFDTYGELKSAITVSALEKGSFKKTVIFISGKSGVGKTLLATKLANVLKKVAFSKVGERWEICKTAAKNSFDEYNGEEILLMDDVRGAALSASDWLKLLDPYSISPISARYHNKVGSAKVIIITSSVDPDKFFQSSENFNGEAIGQIRRRIDYYIDIHDSINSKDSIDLLISEKMVDPYISWLYPDLDDYERYIDYFFKKQETTSVANVLTLVIKKVVDNMKWNNKELNHGSNSRKRTDPRD
ncbi:MAG: Rep family protein, partial [Finegoldia magna]